MIVQLRGKVVDRGAEHVVLDVGGVGYLVGVTTRTADALALHEEDVTLPTHLVVREDQWQLFGFASALERLLFVRLTGVSGLGPRLGLAALQTLEAEDLLSALLAGEVPELTRIPGVGRKLAQRMVLELSEKLKGDPALLAASTAALRTRSSTSPSAAQEDDLRAALLGLGYSSAQVSHVLQALPPTDDPAPALADRLRVALQMLRTG